jgi:hypothetical protein
LFQKRQPKGVAVKIHIGLEVAPEKEENTFSVTTQEGCTIVKGSVPMMMMANLMKGQPKDSVIDMHLGSLLGATLVFGTPKNLKKLRLLAHVRPVNESQFVASQLKPGARDWIEFGEHGMSCVYLFWALTGYSMTGSEPSCHVPIDPADLRRCILMLDTCELNDDFAEFAFPDSAIGWSSLQERWKQLESTFTAEVPDFKDIDISKSAPTTYAIMKSLRGK